MFKTFGVLPVFLVMTVVYISGCSSQKESASNTAPASAPSATVLAAALASTGVDGATSVTAMVKVCELDNVPSLACAVTV